MTKNCRQIATVPDWRTREGRTAARRQRAEAAWGEASADPLTRQRTAMLIAAWLLDDAAHKTTRDRQLADWLRFARPEHARAICTGVAVHALLRCRPAVWDVLMATDAADLAQAHDWYFEGEEAFNWPPDPAWLVP